MTTLEPRRRALREDERDGLRALRDELPAAPAALGRRMAIALAGVVLVLWLLTVLLSDAPAAWISLFWLGFGVLLWVWLRKDLGRQVAHLRAMATSLESALEHGEAESYDIVARGYVEFEEFEDEGACWAFDLGDGRIVFVRGQEFYREEGFPSHDFSIVCAMDESGRPVHEWLEKRGDARPPLRVVAAERKWELADALPEHLEVVRAEIGRLESALEGALRARPSP